MTAPCPPPRDFAGSPFRPRMRCPECHRAGLWQRADLAYCCPGCGHVTPPGRLESHVVAGVLQVLSATPGILVWRNNTGALFDATGRPIRYGLKGSADILGCVRAGTVRAGSAVPPFGLLLAIELKRPGGGSQSPDQHAFEDAISRHGGIYILARSVEEVLDRLDFALARAGVAIPEAP